MMTLKHSDKCGKESAVNFGRFVGAYTIRKDEHRGTMVSFSPDGFHTGTCDRCGYAITYVYVFANPQNETMHVGSDCMHKMGLPLAVVKTAKNYFRDAARVEARKVAEAEAISREEKRKAQVAANLEANAALVDDLRSLQSSKYANAYEKQQLERLIERVGHAGGENFTDPNTWEGEFYENFATRIGLCETSTDQTKDGKRRAMTLEVYRKPIRFDGVYGATYRNFLTDGENAYSYKGNRSFHPGDIVTATWGVKGTETYESLLSTVLERPTKVSVSEAEPT